MVSFSGTEEGKQQALDFLRKNNVGIEIVDKSQHQISMRRSIEEIKNSEDSDPFISGNYPERLEGFEKIKPVLAQAFVTGGNQ